MTRILVILSALAVAVLAMAFAAANAGNRVTLELGILTLYRVPVTLVAFSGLLTGKLLMFATGIYSDLKVRRILRDRLVEEAREEQRWIDINQQDLFAQPEVSEEESPARRDPAPANRREELSANPDPTPVEGREEEAPRE
jgi:uncharacterized integral membrane protein